jgi:signal peptidase I
MNAYDENGPAVNDVVVFIFPEDMVTRYIKRCVAGPGDTVEIKDKVLLINGQQAPEPKTIQFVKPKTAQRGPGGTDSPDNFGPFVVPRRSYFMMGDNRDNSYDSRFWGAVPRHLILGMALRIHVSDNFDRIGMRIE